MLIRPTRRQFIAVTAAAGAGALLSPAVRAQPAEAGSVGLRGGYGYLSSAVLGPQPEDEARDRVAVMASEFGIREFQFYDWFADYSTPCRGDEWTDPYFHRQPISRRTVEVCLDEVRCQGGRAWAYVQAVGAEEADRADDARGIYPLITADGSQYWHPPGQTPGRFPAYFLNDAFAELQVSRWAASIAGLGFDGIHWDTLGRLAAEPAAEAAGVHEFVRQARQLLEPFGLSQTLNFVDLAWWDTALVCECLEFPYAEVWSSASARRYFALMQDPALAARRGAFAMYPTVDLPPGWSQSEAMLDRWVRARDNHLAYILIGDGPRRVLDEYWPKTVPLTDAESAFLRGHA